MDFTEFKKQALENPEIKAEYDKLEPKYELIRAILNARMKAQLTQQELAEKIGVNRADISKLENNKTNPSYNMLCRVAEGLGMKLKIEFIDA